MRRSEYVHSGRAVLQLSARHTFFFFFFNGLPLLERSRVDKMAPQDAVICLPPG